MTKAPILTILLIGGCLTGRAQLTASFSADKGSGCSPLVVHFSNSTTGASAAATYHWDLGNGNLVVVTNPQAIYTTPGNYTITLTVEDGGQSSTTTGTVTVDQPPTVSFGGGVTKTCAEIPFAFIGKSVGGSSAPVSYLWDFGDGITESGGATVSHGYEAAGVYGVSLTVTDADGCSSTEVIPNYVTILPKLTAGFTIPQTVLCTAIDPVTFTNTCTGPGTLSYEWTFGDGNSSTAASPTYSYSKAGTYMVTLNVTNEFGCSATTSLASALNVANYQTNFTLPASVCAGSMVSMVDASNPSPAQRTWLVDGLAIGTASPQSYDFSSAGTHTVSLSNVYGTCPQTLTKTFTVNAPPVMPPFDMVQATPCGAPVTVNFLDHTPGIIKWA